MSLVTLDALDELGDDLQRVAEQIAPFKKKLEDLQELLESVYNAIDNAVDDLDSIESDLRTDYDEELAEANRVEEVAKVIRAEIKKLYDLY